MRATTNNRDVNLALAASDAQTGLMDMRISVDGVFDSETWEPYATSRNATLPDGAGTKTVTVQFRNNAGAISTAERHDRLRAGDGARGADGDRFDPPRRGSQVAFTPGATAAARSPATPPSA